MAARVLKKRSTGRRTSGKWFAPVGDYQARSGDGLPGFLAETALNQDRAEESEPGANGVTLITFHAAKGLEFAHVFLIGLEEGLLPHSRSKLEDNLDEERRLFYVGITRAKRQLTITHCASRPIRKLLTLSAELFFERLGFTIYGNSKLPRANE